MAITTEPVPRKAYPKSARLLKHADFEAVYKRGLRHFSQHFTVFFLARQTASTPRIGLTVSKALGGAVVRNRMKRRLREAVRQNLAALKRPVDVVFNPKKSVLVAESTQLQLEVAKAFEVVNRKTDKI